MRIIAMAFCLVLMCADLVDAQEKSFRLAVPDELSETGLLAYVLAAIFVENRDQDHSCQR